MCTPSKTRFNATESPTVVGRMPIRIGLLCAWVAVLCYAAANSIASHLVSVGQANPMPDGRNAITFANLFVLSSLISLVPMAFLFRADLTRNNLRKLALNDWFLLTVSALISSALTPGLFFFALEHSSVTNVVMIGRIEPPLFLMAASLFLKERFEKKALIAGLVALLGALVMIGFCDTVRLGPGEWAAFAATLSFMSSTLLARKVLKTLPMGIFASIRTVLGVSFYVIFVCVVQGPDQFRGLLSPILLKQVWIYAIVVFVIGQIAWNMALKHAKPSEISLATSFSPVAGVVFAMTLLGEHPGSGLIPGAVLILLAIYIGQCKRPIPGRLKVVWASRPTYSHSDIAQVLVPVAAFPGLSSKGYNGQF
ncbi:DMT family transporter [Roseovarius sp. EL26]|uniref:DMT family transporter n=1 Tax=Roseovarius sp. EL26 TaxID=2126672 RepID=UPI000EA3488A|nr:DMT family transporter [Roseovarius sp. EL26]